MPVLIIYGIPTEMDGQALRTFSDIMRRTASNVKELKITEDQVSVFLPTDLMPKRLGKEIIVFVDGLTEKPERTEKVLKELVLDLIDEVHQSFPEAELVECIIRPYILSGFGRLGPNNSFRSDIRQ